VRTERNRQRLGVTRNFEEAVARLDQEIIFLSDQDDTWFPDKLATFTERFASDPELGLLHSDAVLIDGEGAPIGKSLLEALVVTSEERELITDGAAFQVYARRNLVTGAACAFRRSLLEKAMPFSSRFLHDEWLAFTAALASKIELLEQPTMRYRLHDANTAGVPLRGFGWRVRNRLQAFASPTAQRQANRADRLDDLVAHARSIGVSPDALAYLEAAAGHARFRANLPRNPLSRFLAVQRERAAGHYRAWSSGSVSMLHDLLIAR
jgi:hypothetical protein